MTLITLHRTLTFALTSLVACSTLMWITVFVKAQYAPTISQPCSKSIAYLPNVVAQYPLFGDIDFNGAVDTLDLLSLLADWGISPTCLDADLDKSGEIETNDLLILLLNWGRISTPFDYEIQARPFDGVTWN
ncbi:MAG: hypothetical protein O7G85_07430 [Planctomycetota bacterium]|nr:hypothetical protein [Planctomycetota bacterium]